MSISNDMENLQIASLNVRSLQNKNKGNRIFQYFKSKKHDIILLQETYSTPQDENEWKKEWEGPTFFSSLNNHKSGVAILCTNNQNKLKAFYENSHKPGRHLSIKIEMESSSFIVTNIYAPNLPKKRKKFFQNLETYTKNNDNNILGGDFNMVENILKERAGVNPTTQHYGLEYMKNIKENNNMIDIWQKYNPPRKEHTYCNNLAYFKSRIDFHLENNFKIKTIQNYLSDHQMIALTFYLKNEKKTGTSYWKLNSCILENNEYQNKITSFWQKWQQTKQNCQNPTIW